MKVVQASGFRKRSVARATLKPGSGIVRVNSGLLETYMPLNARRRIMEPLHLAPAYADKLDIHVNVFGGGVTGQADAVRLAIARGIVLYTGDETLKTEYETYDRTLVVADTRRKEMCKPNNSKARHKRQKSYR